MFLIFFSKVSHTSGPNQLLFSQSFGPFDRCYLVQMNQQLLLCAGINTAGFFDHSIRKGAAVTAATNRISKDNIKLLSHWKSDSVDVYINEVNELTRTQQLLHLSEQLYTSVPISTFPLSLTHCSNSSTIMPPSTQCFFGTATLSPSTITSNQRMAR